MRTIVATMNAMRKFIAVSEFLIVAIFLPSGVHAQSEASALTLWYGAPAADWEQNGLPIGNGAMGAMLMGGTAVDDIQFNEKTLWTGGPSAVGGYDFGLPQNSVAGDVAKVRAMLEKDTRLEPEQVSVILGHDQIGSGAYQSFGDVMLSFADAPTAPYDYRRWLDIEHAVAGLVYTADGVHYTRQYFASYPDGVIVMRIAADKPGKISFKASFAIPDNRSVTLGVHDGRITVAGALKDNGLKYEAQLQVIAEGGTRSDGADGSVTVAGADAAVLILSAGTDYAPHYPDYRGADPHEAVQQRVDRAAAKTYAALLADHEKDYRALFDRVSLDIGQKMPDEPTDVLLSQYKDGASAADKAMETLFFQYGRYLLIASSRAGTLPANLQGVWNHSATPPWDADYHVNINLQMNYWLADPTNISEAGIPFYDFVDGLVEPGRIAAKRILGANGWTLFLKTNIWGETGMISWPTAFWQPEAGAWLASQYYDHYRFTLDKEFLAKRAYPAMKAAAEMWLDALVVDPRDGKLVVSPSYSPEHGPFSAGAAMPQQIVTGLFTDTAEAAKILKDDKFHARVEKALAKLDSGLRVGSWGQLQEWKEDWDDPKDEHRHTSHLYALHPGHQISPLTTPKFTNAAKVSLKARGDGGTGWSKAWKINFWARLFDGDHAHLMISQQLRESTLPNLLDTHPPFQIDGNFGAAAGISEMLLQSQSGSIHILPALPAVWPQGEVRGLKARGDVTLDIIWSGGKARQITLYTGHDGQVSIRSTIFAGRFSVVDLASGRQVPVAGTGMRRTINVKRGKRYMLTAVF
jgi:alpha-L-fucosidase 2